MSNAISTIRASTTLHWQEIAETLAPRAGSKEGVLPPLMILLTIVTGIVDAVAYLKLGHVFVANMTGNVVFLGFAAAGASGLSVAGSLLALACFLPGGVAAGRLAARLVWIRTEHVGAERIGGLDDARAGDEVGHELAGRSPFEIVGGEVIGRVDDDLTVPAEALHGLGHAVPGHSDDDDAGRCCLVRRPCRDSLAQL